jgi:hypothetical protein
VSLYPLGYNAVVRDEKEKGRVARNVVRPELSVGVRLVPAGRVTGDWPPGSSPGLILSLSSRVAETTAWVLDAPSKGASRTR